MKINRENYEAFLLDHAEGRLTPGMERELIEFLRINPDLDADTDISFFSLPPDDTLFRDKEGLKKGGTGRVINRQNFEQFCIARMEGDLSGQAEKALDDFLSDNREYAGEASLYELLVLKPDKNVVFPRKGELKKHISGSVVPGYFRKKFLYPAVSVAATLAVLLSVWLLIQNFAGQGELQQNSLAGHESNGSNEQTPSTSTGQPGVIPDSGAGDAIDQINENIIAYETNIKYDVIKASDQIETPIRLSSAARAENLPPARPRFLQAIRVEASEVSSSLRPLQMESLPSQPQYESGERSAGRVLGNLMALLSRALDEEAETDRLTIAGMAEAGLRGLNTLAGTPVSIEREFDEEGQLVFMAFSSPIIEFRRTISSDDDE